MLKRIDNFLSILAWFVSFLPAKVDRFNALVSNLVITISAMPKRKTRAPWNLPDISA